MSGTAVIQAGCCCGGCPGDCSACAPTLCVTVSNLVIHCPDDNITLTYNGTMACTRGGTSSVCLWQPQTPSPLLLYPSVSGFPVNPELVGLNPNIYCLEGKWLVVLGKFNFPYCGFGPGGGFNLSIRYTRDTPPNCPPVGAYPFLDSTFPNTPNHWQVISTGSITVVVCDGPPPAETGACCLPDGSCTVTSQAACQASGGTYQGDNTTCTPNPCPPPVDPIGACCINGGCIERTQSVCVNAGGTWQGPNTTCTPNPCGGTGGKPGACCIPQQGGVFGLCFNNIGEQACLEAQGLYLGDNTTCGFTDCPPPPYGSGRFAAPPSRGLGDTLMKALSWIGVRA